MRAVPQASPEIMKPHPRLLNELPSRSKRNATKKDQGRRNDKGNGKGKDTDKGKKHNDPEPEPKPVPWVRVRPTQAPKTADAAAAAVYENVDDVDSGCYDLSAA